MLPRTENMAEQNSLASKPKRGQQPVLDDRKRQRIFGMIAMGCSRREAARSVGVHVSTIGRTMARDEKFASDIDEAELLARNRPLRAMYDAVDKHWRAAAWMLERSRPDEFARRKPNTYSQRDVREMVDRLLEEALPKVPDEADREAITQAADKFIEELENPEPPEPMNPLVELAKMDEGLAEHHAQRGDREEPLEDG